MVNIEIETGVDNENANSGEHLSLPKEMRDATAPTAIPSDPPPADDRQAAELRELLESEDGKVARAAEKLGVSRQALYRMMKKHGISGE